MHGRARSRRQDEPERTAPGRGTARPAGADAVLELQRGAGNQAVSSLLARETKDKEKPKEEAAGTRATLPGIGTIPLLSVQLGGASRPRNRGREEGENEQAGGDIVLTSRVGKHSQRLLKASLDGKSMTVEVVIAGSGGNVRLELKGAMISSYSTGSGGGEEIETWTLNFQSMEQEVKQRDSE